MIKKTITYVDYDGITRSEAHHFHLSKKELVELELSMPDGLEKTLGRLMDEQDHNKLIELFTKLILMAYGEKTPDGKFIKRDEKGNLLSLAFSQTEAYSELFMELVFDGEMASEFMTGILPHGMAADIASLQAGQSPDAIVPPSLHSIPDSESRPLIVPLPHQQ